MVEEGCPKRDGTDEDYLRGLTMDKLDMSWTTYQSKSDGNYKLKIDSTIHQCNVCNEIILGWPAIEHVFERHWDGPESSVSPKMRRLSAEEVKILHDMTKHEAFRAWCARMRHDREVVKSDNSILRPNQITPSQYLIKGQSESSCVPSTDVILQTRNLQNIPIGENIQEMIFNNRSQEIDSDIPHAAEIIHDNLQSPNNSSLEGSDSSTLVNEEESNTSSMSSSPKSSDSSTLVFSEESSCSTLSSLSQETVISVIYDDTDKHYEKGSSYASTHRSSAETAEAFNQNSSQQEFTNADNILDAYPISPAAFHPNPSTNYIDQQTFPQEYSYQNSINTADNNSPTIENMAHQSVWNENRNGHYIDQKALSHAYSNHNSINIADTNSSMIENIPNQPTWDTDEIPYYIDQGLSHEYSYHNSKNIGETCNPIIQNKNPNGITYYIDQKKLPQNYIYQNSMMEYNNLSNQPHYSENEAISNSMPVNEPQDQNNTGYYYVNHPEGCHYWVSFNNIPNSSDCINPQNNTTNNNNQNDHPNLNNNAAILSQSLPTHEEDLYRQQYSTYRGLLSQMARSNNWPSLFK